jgi:hypothetical protein
MNNTFSRHPVRPFSLPILKGYSRPWQSGNVLLFAGLSSLVLG